jgi:hypothetical protein
LGRIKECLTETNEYDEEAMIDAWMLDPVRVNA